MPNLGNVAEVVASQALAANEDTSPQKPKEARIVKVPLDDNLHITGVKDPEAKSGKLVKRDLDVEGLHYGWGLSKIMKDDPPAGTPFNFPGDVHICPNLDSDEEDQNTLAIQPPQLLKLDCGYWGSYIHHGIRQRYRDFGLVLGPWVWLCKLVPGSQASDSSSLDSDIEEHIPKGPSAVRSFFEAVQKTYFRIQIVKYAQALSSEATQALDPKTLVAIFPDLHLPERWPDEPDEAKRPTGKAREALQQELMAAQHAPGWKSLNDMSTARQTLIQDYLEELIDKSSKKPWTNLSTTDKDKPAVPYVYTSEQVLAELAFIDRRIKAASTWFYYEGLTQFNRMTGPNAKDLAPKGPLMGNPAPAVDLVNLLQLLKDLQKEQPVSVVQLGDLMEMWSGREFLYYFFPVCDSDLGAAAVVGLEAATLYSGDDLQLRRDGGWKDPTVGTIDGFKHFVYDPAHIWEMLPRHATGAHIGHHPDYTTNEQMYTAIGKRYHKQVDSLKQSAVSLLHLGPDDEALEATGKKIVSRLSKLVGQRAHNVRNFCLPLPKIEKLPTEQSTGLADGIAALKKIDGGKFFDNHRRPQRIGSDEHAWSTANQMQWKLHSDSKDNGEFFWNAMILDMLQSLKFVNIHGNHDGYRSDPLLKGGIADSTFQAVPTIDNVPSGYTGIWFEHGHRWDEFNRDGRIYGAGMTNLVYYQFDSMLFLDTTKDIVMTPSEQSSEQAGAAQWYRIASFLKPEEKVGFSTKKTFAVYVSGHTHVADLVRFKFEAPEKKKQDESKSFLDKVKGLAGKAEDKATALAGKYT